MFVTMCVLCICMYVLHLCILYNSIYMYIHTYRTNQYTWDSNS